ncbi:hypothetical protein FHS43_005913 [Streptosporangium becharense]|uniref:Probable membrane transporter protein n=1 Tax=Streptosporangium becharense TaxID=1816182 RepID=A0A7W9IN86_9ACTN|nr:sulfite exporter TauE/SafE family protein [Streptosporangium becharense]MBB2914601.1 hypothetical protein [Streptosporangium becharense]MBB5823446.1 putative membrane protein YfcA [Streptosporangium becharense]
MAVAEVLGLFGTGVLAGVVGTVVSLASIVSYPVLLAFGLSPLSANVTNTVALTFNGLGAAAGSRPELVGQGGRVLRLGAVTLLGGAVGAALLLATPSDTFEAIAPWLIAAASLLLIRPPGTGRGTGGGGGRPVAGDGDGDRTGTGGGDGSGSGRAARGGGGEGGRAARAAMFAVAIYIGYFGAAGGILMFAVLSAVLDQEPVKVNAVKNVISSCSNGVAALGFALFGPVQWSAVAPLAAGFLLGGWIGPAIARRLPGPALRLGTAACGLLVAAKLGLDTYT